jgi:hypothetical protein
MLQTEVKRATSNLSITVEFRNKDKATRNGSSYIPKNSPEVHLFKRIRSRIEAHIRNTVPEVHRISYSMRAPKQQTSGLVPTIMITTQENTNAYWGDIHESIRNELARLVTQPGLNPQNLQPKFEIHGGIRQQNNAFEYAEWGPMSWPVLPLQFGPGSSIGPRNYPKDAGSMGAFINLQYPGSTQAVACVVTCYHVIANGATDRDSRECYEGEGIWIDGNSSKHGQTIIVDYPGGIDAEYAEQRLEDAIAQRKPAHIIQERQRVVNVIKHHHDSGGLGVVIHASGKFRASRGPPSRWMDWSVIRLNDPARSTQNPVTPPTAQLMSYIGKYSEDYDLRHNDKVVRVGDLTGNIGQCVAKQSRTSGANAGYVNGMTFSMEWKRYGDWLTEEIEIKPAISGDPTFARNGDSGKSDVLTCRALTLHELTLYRVYGPQFRW